MGFFSLERFLLEGFAVAVMVGLSFGVTKFYVLAPLDPSLSKEQNHQLFLALPAAVYFAYRLFFGLVLSLGSLVKRFKPIGSQRCSLFVGEILCFGFVWNVVCVCPIIDLPILPVLSPHSVLPSVNILVALICIASVAWLAFLPAVQDSAKSLLTLLFGNVLEILQNELQKPFEKSVSFLYQMSLLLGLWFVALVALELILFVVLWLVSLLIGVVLSLFSPSKAVVCNENNENTTEASTQ